jgi:L-malate glycosyltransferase
MSKPRAIHQILPTLGFGDAIGNQVLEIKHLIQKGGGESEIFVEHYDPRLASECRHYEQYRRYSDERNLLILHYSIGGAVNRFVLDLPDRLILYYHNVTPARFFYRWNGDMALRLKEASRDLVSLAGKFPAIVGSSYNKHELDSLGFQVVGIAPYILSFDQLDASLNAPGAAMLKRRFEDPDTVDWLFVGRLAPNKCIHDIIKSFYYFHHWMNVKSRLLLVGTSEGSEAYVSHLYRLVTRLDLDGAVIFTGQVDSPAPFYKMADLYLSMSEHEGFGMPLLEAMHFDVPVLAYGSTAVPEIMGNAGVLFHEKDFPVVAEMANEIISDSKLRHRLLTSQRGHLGEFDPEQARTNLEMWLKRLDAVSAFHPAA